MNVPGTVQQITLLKGSVVQLRDDVKQLTELVAFMFDALCDARPELREPLAGLILKEIRDEELRPGARRQERAKIFRDGLEAIYHRVGKT